jgi:hypothetical protein
LADPWPAAALTSWGNLSPAAGIFFTKDGTMKQNELATVDNLPTAQVVTPMDLLQVAHSQGADLDRLQQLMDMQFRWEENEARKAYHAAIASFKSENIKIIKDAVVDFTGSKGRTYYRHASLANVVAQVTEAMCKHALSHSWSMTQNTENGIITVTCKISHVAGHSETVSLSASPDNSGNKNSIQAIASTVTYLERYTLLSALGLATHDDDSAAAEQEEIEYVSEDQLANIDALIAETKTVPEQFCKFMKVEEVSLIPADWYETAIKALETKRSA